MDKVIGYGVVVNARAGQGFLPVIFADGQQYGHTYAVHGYDRETAMAMAKVDAQEEADRFTGDWRIAVVEVK